MFSGHFQDMRIEVIEGGGKEQLGAVQLDHTLHGLTNVVGVGNPFLLFHVNTWNRPDGVGAGRVSLVVTVIILRPDIDEADRQRSISCRWSSDAAPENPSCQRA